MSGSCGRKVGAIFGPEEVEICPIPDSIVLQRSYWASEQARELILEYVKVVREE